jgi:hypothetical protein
MDETRVGHKKTTEKQTGILTPGQDAQKQKRQPKLPFYSKTARLSWRGA